MVALVLRCRRRRFLLRCARASGSRRNLNPSSGLNLLLGGEEKRREATPFEFSHFGCVFARAGKVISIWPPACAYRFGEESMRAARRSKLTMIAPGRKRATCSLRLPFRFDKN